MIIHIILNEEELEIYPESWAEADRVYAEYTAWRESEEKEQSENSD